ncbi:MFS transporter [Aureibacillus halotolerans]|uniref:YQGE family putative transporter n=1 Tax=Aureibacillus halotolerans TaxID=1508390 RepID=A0A4R6U9N8_9BACI|nr:MFS transporter [Aureibacillus halotolerans]TDQ41703.1 YQGE family putative transporter [Aureibacillus halotolerans]
MKTLLRNMTGNTGGSQRALLLLISIGGLYALSIALSNTFVNIYLWKQSGNYTDLAIYNLAQVILQPLTFLFAGRLAKKVDRVLVLRIGVIFLALFYLAVLMVGGASSQYLVLLGSLLGIGFGFYWLAFNVLTFEITEPDTRDFFNGFLGFISSFSGMVGPLAAGYIIASMEQFTGYTTIFTTSLILFAGAVALSFLLLPRPASGRYEWKRIWTEQTYNKDWKRILNAHFFQGLREGTFIFAITLWVFIATQSELAIGTFSLVHSSVALCFYYIAARYIPPTRRKLAILVAGAMMYASVLLLMFTLKFPLLMIYAVCTGIAYPVVMVPFASLTYDVIGRGWRAADMRVEYVVIKELFLNAGRAVSILMFIVAVTAFSPTVSLPVLIGVIGSGHFLIYFCIRRIHTVTPTRDDDKKAVSDSWRMQENNADPR